MCLCWRVTKPPPTHLLSLTSMRAVAALIVFAFHAGIPHLERLTGQGRIGVSFFFVLSGLLLGSRYRRQDTAGQFYRRRFARIYPAYLVALLAGVVVSALSGERNESYGLLSFVLLQAWAPDQHVYFVWNAVSWSLSVEAFFYALFPLLAPAVLRLRGRGTRAVQLSCVAVVVGLGVWGHVSVAGSGEGTGELASWATYIFPVARLSEFVLGLTLVRALNGPRLPVTKVQATVLFVLAYLAAGLDPLGFGLISLTLVPIALLLVVYAQADQAGEPSVAHLAPLVRLGEWSYCFYLVHQLALRVAERYVDGAFPLSTAVVALPLALLSAWSLHVLVEKPFDARLNGRSRAAGTGHQLPQR